MKFHFLAHNKLSLIPSLREERDDCDEVTIRVSFKNEIMQLTFLQYLLSKKTLFISRIRHSKLHLAYL